MSRYFVRLLLTEQKNAIYLSKNPSLTLALDINRKEIGFSKGELRDGLFYIQPVTDAVSF